MIISYKLSRNDNFLENICNYGEMKYMLLLFKKYIIQLML